MRTIDADALIEKCGDWYVEEGTEIGFIGTLKSLINRQPTIQPDAPRVMTLDEIREAGDDNAIFIEYKLGSEIKLRPAIFQPENSDDEYMCVVSAWCASGFYSCKTYNIDWRCWTGRPTEEQREGQDWNGVKG